MKPILFNTEMVRAILDGRKTVTRRIIKPQPRGHAALSRKVQGTDVKQTRSGVIRKVWSGYEFEDGTMAVCNIQPGDILYVRETWGKTADLPGISEEATVYAADFSDRELAHLKDKHFRWRPSIHMPKELARLFLKVTDVRVERLQNISADGCAMEGIWPLYSGPAGGRTEYYHDKFSYLWDSTIPKTDMDTYGWKANPWVWAIQFEVCEKPEEIQ